ncbi:MAG: zinc ribbon domain-containing protein, partial [Dehalococcoidia bacterium]|nr:zinc ribbon domain-containing protein [Dehalococcoidia bacterium]
AASDKPLTIKNMKVSVWPEYDDSRVLVIYQGEFNDGTSFPRLVKFPALLGSEINQVCAIKQPGDVHLCQLYDTSTEQDNLNISYTLPIPTYLLEYYWDGIKGLPDKSFTFKYQAPYAVDKLDLEIQQPLKASDFKLVPNYASVNSDNLGMKFYHYIFNNVTPGQVISVDASYVKGDNKPSVAKKPGSGTGSSTGAGGGLNYYWILGIAAAAVVAFITYKVFNRKPAYVPARTAPSRRAARVEAARYVETNVPRREPFRQSRGEQPGTAAPIAQQGTVTSAFCSNCGVRLNAGDKFCHACGEKTRRAL